MKSIILALILAVSGQAMAAKLKCTSERGITYLLDYDLGTNTSSLKAKYIGSQSFQLVYNSGDVDVLASARKLVASYQEPAKSWAQVEECFQHISMSKSSISLETGLGTIHNTGKAITKPGVPPHLCRHPRMRRAPRIPVRCEVSDCPECNICPECEELIGVECPECEIFEKKAILCPECEVIPKSSWFCPECEKEKAPKISQSCPECNIIKPPKKA